jgi:hypothetical protein
MFGGTTAEGDAIVSGMFASVQIVAISQDA